MKFEIGSWVLLDETYYNYFGRIIGVNDGLGYTRYDIESPDVSNFVDKENIVRAVGLDEVVEHLFERVKFLEEEKEDKIDCKLEDLKNELKEWVSSKFRY